MWVLLMSLALGAEVQAQGTYSAAQRPCACFCSLGLDITLCDSVAQAQQQGNLCASALPCDSATGLGETALAQLVQVIRSGRSCQSVRIWDAELAVYRTVSICNPSGP